MSRRTRWGRLPIFAFFGIMLAGCGSGPKSTGIDKRSAPIRSLSDFKNFTLRGELGTRWAAADVDLPELGARLEIRSAFPAMNRAVLTIRCDRPVKLEMRLRRPGHLSPAADL